MAYELPMDNLILLMTEPFLLRAIAAGILLVLIAGPLGCFLIWRRQAFFGDTLAHTAILGLGIGFAVGAGAPTGLIATIIIMALFLTYAEGRYGLALDTLLGVMAHGGLAFGLLFASLYGGIPGGINRFLFGDILAVDLTGLLISGAISAIGLLLLVRFWRGLLAITISEALAAADGYRIKHYRVFLMLLTGAVIAIGIKLIGALLISALLIIPAAAARRFASGPEQMAIGAVIAGVISIIGGLYLSLAVNAPAGPAIITIATTLFIASLIGTNQIIRR